MMNASIKSAIKNPNSCCFQIRSAFFHSTPFLEKGRRNNNWNRSSSHNPFGRYRRNRYKGDKLKDANAFINHMFQSWESDEQPSNTGPSWFNGTNNGQRKNNFQGNQNKGKRVFSFCEDNDDDVETIFKSAFGDRFFFWSINDDYPYGKRPQQSKSYKESWKYQSEDEYEYYTTEESYRKSHSDSRQSHSESRKSHLAPERTALGLSASGPLKLEDVKTAYRASALKWHPDRHQGASKIDAEEKFKHCTAAYQSLCESFTVS